MLFIAIFNILPHHKLKTIRISDKYYNILRGKEKERKQFDIRQEKKK